MKNLNIFLTTLEYESVKENLVIPSVSLCKDDMKIYYNSFHDYSQDYFTTVALEDGTISFNIWKTMGTDMINSISYSTNNGKTWTTTNNVDNKEEHLTINVNVIEGAKVLWKGDAIQLGFFDEDEDVGDIVGSFFSSTCEFNVEGNVMSLLFGDEFTDKTSLSGKDYAFAFLFYDYYEQTECKIVSAANLSLPATTLAYGCYWSMFLGCTSLTTAPSVLPATTLDVQCYYQMFRDCTSLTTAPELPAEALTEGCYSLMFYGCTSLHEAPQLPATTLASKCYNGMFGQCSKLTTAPELPATTLAENCYQNMFSNCTSLTIAPELHATTLATSCYSSMFRSCTNLTTAPELPATTLTQQCYWSMFLGCTSLTTAPSVLPATTLASKCYNGMFDGCTSLTAITCLATDISASNCTTKWVRGVASTGTFTKAASMTSWTTGSDGIPANWTVKNYGEKDYSQDYFTTVALENGTISFNGNNTANTFSYSTDGSTWSTPAQVNTVEVREGDKVLWKGTATPKKSNGIGKFTSDASFNVEGNAMSLLFGDVFKGQTDLTSKNSAFYGLFEGNQQVISAENLSLPATTLAVNCYSWMFKDCTSLTTAPELPATALTNNCYYGMFYGCTSLMKAPELPATTLASSCYNAMFKDCTSLTTAPSVLPAIILSEGCYGGMFSGCTSLTTAPELLATTLADECCLNMFVNCTSLTSAPQLPATTLADYCYNKMFSGCTSLTAITCLATDISASSCTTNWVNGVASTGTFTRPSSMTSWTSGVNGIPSGWSVQDY